jgi:RNA polymerase sigma factor (sigma-70 family)
MDLSIDFEILRGTKGSAEDRDREWDALARTILGPVQSRLMDFFRDPQAVEDSLHRIWVLVARNVHQVREPEKFSSWVATVADRAVLGEIRRWRRRAAVVVSFDQDPRIARQVGTTPASPTGPGRYDDPLDQLAAELETERMLSVLSDHDRTFAQRWLAGWSHAELAAEYGLANPDVSESKWKRIRDRLRRAWLQPAGPGGKASGLREQSRGAGRRETSSGSARGSGEFDGS